MKVRNVKTKRSILKIASLLVVTAILAGVMVSLLAGCADETPFSVISVKEIGYIDEIQGNGNLYFEWLKPYNPSKPTAIIIHGETTGKGEEKFTMTLDAKEYTFKSDFADSKTTEYTVAENIGYKAQGLNRDLSYYWLSVANWNVAIFHWEAFADEENPEDILVKLFSVPKMRYVNDGKYETNRVPKYSLTEVFVSLYLKEMEGKINGNEIRFIGNGVGANLALSAMHYLAINKDKTTQIDKNVLPNRLALCDPYLSVDDMHIANNTLAWAETPTTDGFLGMTESMLAAVTGYGAAVEMVESVEISSRQETTSDGNTITRTTATYAYDIEESEKADEMYKNMKQYVAYLEFRESYTVRFSDGYKALKRTAMDWYLYSIVGSDDSGNAGATYPSGYPRNLSDFQTYMSYSGFNWATNETRPMTNNRQLNNDSTATAPSSRGKNYSLSAWTPTVYTRALKGISFKMKKFLSRKNETNVHGNNTYNLSDYTLSLFRSENFQVSDQSDYSELNRSHYTLICGYVYMDLNGDSTMNDGYEGLANVAIGVKITKGSGSSSTELANFKVYTDNTGFYVIRLNTATVDSEGNISKSGYAFNETHTVTLTFVPDSHDYVSIASATSGPFYNTINRHNFSSYTGTVTLSSYYADAISISTCLVKVVK